MIKKVLVYKNMQRETASGPFTLFSKVLAMQNVEVVPLFINQNKGFKHACHTITRTIQNITDINHGIIKESLGHSLHLIILNKVYTVHCKKKYRKIYRKIRASNLPTNYCKIYRNTVNFLQFINVKLTVYCKYFYKKLDFVCFTVFM